MLENEFIKKTKGKNYIIKQAFKDAGIDIRAQKPLTEKRNIKNVYNK